MCGAQVTPFLDLLICYLEAEIQTASIVPPTELLPAERQAFDKMEKSIAISAYHDSRARSATSRCLGGTRKNQIETIMQWIEEEAEKKPLFVVLGSAGCGKSSLLRTISHLSDAKGYLAATFFFSSTDSKLKTDSEPPLINTIAYQIATAIPQLRPYVARIVDADPTILSRSFESQITNLLLQPLSQLQEEYPMFSFRPRVIVIDALDECGDLDDQLRVISALSGILSHRSFPFICVISTRYNAHIENQLSKLLVPHVHDQVILGNAESNTERADVYAYLSANISRIRDNHTFQRYIPHGWPADSDVETIVERSSGQFIYAATVIKYIDSPKHNPCHRFQSVLDISAAGARTDPFTAVLDDLYRSLMSSIENLEAAIEILGIQLVWSSSQFWTPRTLDYTRVFRLHFTSLDADIVLAPLAPVLKCEDDIIQLHHLSFAEFLLDRARSREFFVNPTVWQNWVVSQLVPVFYDKECMYADRVRD